MAARKDSYRSIDQRREIGAVSDRKTPGRGGVGNVLLLSQPKRSRHNTKHQ